MSLFTKLGNDIASPVDASGNKRSVENIDVQRWMTEVERLFAAFQAGGGVIFQSRSEADANLGYDANTMAWVLGDPVAGNNGVYQKQGASGSGSWQRLGDLPYSFILSTNTNSGDPNAIEATTATPIPAADGGALISLNVVADNTGSPVTVSFNGAPALTVKTISGNDIPVGGLTAGMRVDGYKVGSTFQLRTDIASASIVAAAQDAADRAEGFAAMQSADKVKFKTVPLLLADELMSYTSEPSKVHVGPGDVIEAGGFRYEVAASGAADAHVETAGGVKLFALPNGSGEIHTTQLGAAVGGDASDNHAAILAAIEATPINGTLVFPGEGGYFGADDQIVINKSISVDMRAPARYTGTSVQPFLVFGDATVSTVLRKQKFRIKVERATYTDWTDENDIGVQILNAFSVDDLVIDQAQGFMIGVQCRASNGQGWSHVKAYLNDLVQNKIHLDLVGDTSGYVNENKFFGGRFTNFGSSLPDNGDPSGRRAVRLRSEDGSYTNLNNNILYSPCFQNSGGTGFEILHGAMNRVIAGRSEGPIAAARFANNAARNTIDIEYATANDSETYVNDSDNATNVVTFGRYSDRLQSKVPTYLAPDLRSRWIPYSSSASYFQGLAIATLAGGGGISLAAGGATTIVGHDNHVSLSGFAVGRLITTRNAKRFFLQIDHEADSDHWVIIRAYDSSGNQIVAADPSEISQYLRGGARAGETFTSIQYGFWRNTSTTDRVTFEVSAQVHAIWVGVGRSSAATAKIRGFGIYALGDVVAPRTARGDDAFDYPYLLATQAPDRGVHAQGLVVNRLNVASGKTPGWVCTNTGEPGTWAPMAALGENLE